MLYNLLQITVNNTTIMEVILGHIHKEINPSQHYQ